MGAPNLQMKKKKKPSNFWYLKNEHKREEGREGGRE